MRELYPVLPQHHRRRRAPDLRRDRARRVPLERTEVPSGTQVFDWTVPREWNIRDARLDGARRRAGRRLRRLEPPRPQLQRPRQRHVLARRAAPAPLHRPRAARRDPVPHLVLQRELGLLPAPQPLRAARRGRLRGRDRLDASRTGTLIYAERFLPGESEDEVLVSTYVCHPSLANDNLSGIVLAATLGDAARRPAACAARYRFLFSPGDDRPAHLAGAQRGAAAADHRAASSPACVGDPGPFTYKRSRRGDAEIDRAVAARARRATARIEDFTPLGNDERQFCSPGFDLPVGVLSRTPHGPLPRVPLLRGRPRLRPARGARRIVRRATST